MEPEYSLTHSQVPAMCPNPVTAPSSPQPTSYFLSIYLNIIFQSKPWSAKCSLSLKVPHRKLAYASLSPIRATCPAHPILDFITRTILGEQYSSFSSSLCSFLHSAVTSSLLSQNSLLSTLFSNTLCLCSSLNVSDQVSHPYKTTGRIIVLYILILKFLDSKLENKRFYTE